MYKCIALLKCRPDMDREAFIDYYESRHAPLIQRLLPGIVDYRRNYVQHDGAFLFPGAAPVDFDVITEIWLADRAAYDHFIARAAEPDIASQIANDEANLFDRATMRMLVVEERGEAKGTGSLTMLLDEREIMRALGDFARILDTKRWDRLGEVFAQDITFDYGSGVDQQGMAALKFQMQRFLDYCGGTQHLLGSIQVDVEGDQATSRTYVQARHQRVDNPAGPIFDSNGEYVDRWERRAAGWRIVRRDALWAAHSGDPAILAAGQEDLG